MLCTAGDDRGAAVLNRSGANSSTLLLHDKGSAHFVGNLLSREL